MNLHDYLASDDALTVGQLSAAIGAKSDMQVRQWQHGYADRVPGPAYCVAIERATGKKVRRWDLRPDDWHRIWPELLDDPDAPKISATAG
jgi:DNA-binding transcriptional regulator YdaS (Cro superfamily)